MMLDGNLAMGRTELDSKRALDIYARLHKLTPSEAASVNQEVFVALGRRLLPKPVEVQEENARVRWEDPDSTLRQIKRRLRGRVNSELRDWVEYHTGRTETALFWAHIENAHEFVDLLEKNRSVSEAVSLYADQIGLSPSWTEIIYFIVLDQRSPVARANGLGSSAVVRPRWPISETGSAPLRIVEKRRDRGRHRAG